MRRFTRRRKKPIQQRRRLLESLEARQLLAGDVVDAIVDRGPLVRMNEAPILGDFNKDGEVGFLDFLKIANHFGQQGKAEDGDVNGDGVISFEDFKIFVQNYGQSSAPTEFELVAASSLGSDSIILTFTDQPAPISTAAENFQITFCRNDVVCTPETTETLDIATATAIPNSTQISLKAASEVPAEANITVTPSKKMTSVSGLRKTVARRRHLTIRCREL